MKKNNKKGFTLVELVIVVAVMAVLVAVAIPTIGSITGTAKEAVYDSNCRTIESVLKLYEAEQSKNSGTTTTSSSSGLNAAGCTSALTAAKLGIQGAEGGTAFYYHGSVGIVNDTAEGATVTITYNPDGTFTCS